MKSGFFLWHLPGGCSAKAEETAGDLGRCLFLYFFIQKL
jgi:hypothetical protein